MDPRDAARTSRAIRRLALLQGTVFGIVVGLGSLLIAWFVLARQAVPVSPGPPAPPAPGRPHVRPPQPSTEPASDVTETIPWRYDLGTDKIQSIAVTPCGTCWLVTMPLERMYPSTSSVIALDSQGRVAFKREFAYGATGGDGWPLAVYASGERDLVLYCQRLGQGFSEDFIELWNGQGRSRWSATLEGQPTKQLGVGADGAVYYTTELPAPPGTHNSRLVALSASGSRLWHYDDVEYLGVPVPGKEGRVFVTRGDPDRRIQTIGSNMRYIAALEPGGKRAWMLDRGNEAVLNPLVGATGRLYVYSAHYGDPGGNALLAVNPASGESVARFACTLGDRSMAAGPDGTLYVEKKDRMLVALDPGLKIKWSAPIEYSVGDYPRLVPCADGTVFFGDVHLRHIGSSGEDLGSFHVKALRRLYAGPGGTLIAAADDADGYRVLGINP